MGRVPCKCLQFDLCLWYCYLLCGKYTTFIISLKAQLSYDYNVYNHEARESGSTLVSYKVLDDSYFMFWC